ATIAVTGKYRTALKIKAADSTASVKVNVVAADDDEKKLRASNAQRQTNRAPAPTKLVGTAVKPTGPLPDLRSLPAWSISVEDGRYLNFSATVWNAGPSPLVVDGFRQTDNEDLMDAYQYFFDAAGTQVGYSPVGTMEWDRRDGHNHWHFTDFASYRLLDKDKKLVVRSQKEAFCLANTDAVDYTVPDANWKPDNTDLHTSCGGETSIGVREVLDTGSGDTYAQYLPGQSFDLKGLKNGVYYIFVGANPDKKLYESSTSNNNSYRKVTISGTSGHRAVKVAKVGIITEPPIKDEDEDH
ncbi:MAG: lysyl oxidase family protein, partial [Propionibacteriaceae bacterium]